MKLTKDQYNSLPEALKSLCTADGEEYAFDTSALKTQTDIDNVKEAKDKEKALRVAAEKAAKDLERSKNELSDKVAAYESDESKKLDAEQLVEFQRLKRENETLSADKEDLSTKYTGLQQEITIGRRDSQLTSALDGLVNPESKKDVLELIKNKFVISDGKLLTNTEQGDKSGIEAKDYVSQFVKDRPYFQPTNSGAGAGGAGSAGVGSQTNSDDSGEISLFQSQS